MQKFDIENDRSFFFFYSNRARNNLCGRKVLPTIGVTRVVKTCGWVRVWNI